MSELAEARRSRRSEDSRLTFIRLIAIPFTLALLVLSATAGAQPHIADTNQGFAPNATFATTGLDHVNLFNGNLVISLPIGPNYPIGPGFSHQLRLTYNSQIWGGQGACTENPFPNDVRIYFGTYVRGLPIVGAGWNLEMGHVDQDPDTWTYHGPDGSISPIAVTSNVGTSTDATFLRARFSGSPPPFSSVEVYFPDGTTGVFGQPISSDQFAHGSTGNDFRHTSGFYLTALKDRFLNSITVSYEFV